MFFQWPSKVWGGALGERRAAAHDCNQMGDVKVAFRVFDHNNDGTISKEELQEAMLNFGQRFSEE